MSAVLGPAGFTSIVASAAAVALVLPPARARLRAASVAVMGVAELTDQDWWLRRYRWLLGAGAAAGAWVVVGGPVGVAAGAAAAGWCWHAIGRAEPGEVTARRRAVAADLPVLVRLIATGLRAGLAPAPACEMAARALEGPASTRLLGLLAPLGLGADPGEVWRRVATEPGLGPLGAALVRAHETGAAIGVVVERLAVELGREARASVEDRARRVGVQAAVPLGVCLLPAFLVLGIVPVVAGLAGALGL